MGRVQGSIFLIRFPGKNPNSSSSTGTTGLVKTILWICWDLRSCIAAKQANKVLPDPAGPVPKTIGKSLFLRALTYNFWLSVLALYCGMSDFLDFFEDVEKKSLVYFS